jgi:hypothetical protein
MTVCASVFYLVPCASCTMSLKPLYMCVLDLVAQIMPYVKGRQEESRGSSSVVGVSLTVTRHFAVCKTRQQINLFHIITHHLMKWTQHA